MKKWLEFLVGFATGFGLGFFTMEQYYRKKHPESTDIPQTVPVIETATDEQTAEQICKDEQYISDEESADEYLAEHEHPEEEEEDTDDTTTSASIDESQYIFVSDAYEWEATDLDRREFTYYGEDETVCDEDEVRIEDPEELIGSHTLEMLNDLNPVVYIRNTWNDTMYKITYVGNAFGRVVLGIDEEYPI